MVHAGRPRKDRENHGQPGRGRPRRDRPARAGGLLCQPRRFHPHRDPRAARDPRGRRRADRRPEDLVLGTQRFTRRDLEALRAAGKKIEIRVLGLASIADDVSAELAKATIASVEVLGAFRASEAVKAALADRMV